METPPIDTAIFHIDEKHEASLKNKIPTQVLDELANQAEKYACEANKVKPNIKQ